MLLQQLAERLRVQANRLRAGRVVPTVDQPKAMSPTPDPLDGLTAAEKRLAALAVSLRGARAGELLVLVGSRRGENLRAAAEALATLERSERRALISRILAPPASSGSIAATALVEQLARAPAWVRAQACSELPGDLRAALIEDAAVRRAWGQLPAHHPALGRWTRRRLTLLRLGSLFRDRTPVVPPRNSSGGTVSERA